MIVTSVSAQACLFAALGLVVFCNLAAAGAKFEGKSSGASGVTLRQPNPRVAQWFARYDSIRHAAQMEKSEKRNAHKIVKAALSGNLKDKQESRSLVKSLSARYDRAIRDLSKLPYIPQTGELQHQYLNYFKTSRQFFTSYLKQIDKPFSPAALAQMHEARRNIAAIDMSSKTLDRELRRKYKIAPYKWD
jgi:hypothetical protein